MSSGDNDDKESSQPRAEDFSPPKDSLGGAAGPDILELIVKFELLGPHSEAAIQKLRAEVEAPSERLLAGALVERGYLSEEEMESMVLARYLLACGKITMTQLELVMDEIKDTRAPLWVSLVAKGWLKMGDVV
ncbi:MAG: hypothetical protein JSS86_13970 [Cyanobacteria bacterium SZAS LIN-2]|nr:hypothetical protein [Cyanobacteria bacterium SZAS LIN-2]